MKKFLLVIATFLFGAGAAFGQAFPNYPTVGVPADTECLSYGNNGVCNQYRPAGPDNLVPTATIPADTNSPNGQNPQTVRVPVALLGVAVQHLPVGTTTATINAGTGRVMIEGSGVIAAVTLTLPHAASLTDGQTLTIGANQTVTTLTLTPGSGTTVLGTNAVSAAAGVILMYDETTAQWLKIQ